MASKKKIIRLTGREADEDWGGAKTKPLQDIDPSAGATDRYVEADRSPRKAAVSKAAKLAQVRRGFTGKKAKKAFLKDAGKFLKAPYTAPGKLLRSGEKPETKEEKLEVRPSKFRSKVVKEPEMAPPPLAKIRPKRRKAVVPRKEAAQRLKEKGQRSTPAERRVALAKSKRNREYGLKEKWFRKLPLDDDNR